LSHYLGNISPELQVDVDVLKDMLMFRENVQQRAEFVLGCSSWYIDGVFVF